MTIITVSPGQYYTFSGTLGAADSLYAYGSFFPVNPGDAVVAIRGTDRAVNDGRMELFGGAANAGAQLQDAGTLVNHGSLDLLGSSGQYFGAVGSGAQATITGVLTNTAALLIGGGGSSGYPVPIGLGATLTSTGQLNNSGDVRVFAAAPSAFYGPSNGGGVLADDGRMASIGTVEIYGSYSGLNAAGRAATFAVGGVLTNAGIVTLDGGTGFGGNGGVLDTTGLLVNQGTLAALGGYGYGLGQAATGAAIDVAGMLNNHGLIEIGASQDRYLPGIDFNGLAATLALEGVLTNSGSIILAAALDSRNGAMTIAAHGTLEQSGILAGGGTLTNAGLIVSAGHGAQIAVAGFINDGAVTVGPGSTLALSSAVTTDTGASGIFHLLADSTLTVAGALSSAQTVMFQGAHADLALSDAVGFAGTLGGMQLPATIDFLGLQVTSATSAGQVLSIGLSTGATLSFSLAAALAADVSLGLTADGAGGTDVVFGRGSHPGQTAAAALHAGESYAGAAYSATAAITLAPAQHIAF